MTLDLTPGKVQDDDNDLFNSKEKVNYFNDILEAALRRRNNKHRVRRDAEAGPELNTEINMGEEVVSGLLGSALRERAHTTASNAQTVGALLATIPGILDKHGVSFDAIANNILNFESSLEDVFSSGFTQISNTIKETVPELKEAVHDGLHDISEKMINDEQLQETLHNGLDSIVEKLGNTVNVEETLHDGFHSIADKLQNSEKLEDTIHDGLHDISEKIDSVTTYGLSGIINSLDHSKHPHPALAPGHGHVDGHYHGHYSLTELSEDLKGIITSIDSHGESIVNTLTEKQALERIEELEEEQIKKEIIEVLEGMTSAISDGNGLVSDAIINGNEKLTEAFEDGSDSISSSITTSNEKIAESNEEIAKEITAGNVKIAESIDASKSSIDTLKADVVNSINNNRDAIASVKNGMAH